MGDERAKQVYDHTKAGNGGCKCNCKAKKGRRCFSQKCEEPHLEGQKAACGLRVALCLPLIWSI